MQDCVGALYPLLQMAQDAQGQAGDACEGPAASELTGASPGLPEAAAAAGEALLALLQVWTGHPDSVLPR